MDELLDKAWYLVAILFWLIPSLMRWLAKRRRSQAAQQPPPKPARTFEPERPAAPPTPPAPVSFPAPAVAVDTGPRDTLSARARAAREATGDLERRCQLHGGPAARLLPAVRDDLKAPLDTIIERLGARDRVLGPGEHQRLERDVARLEHLADLLGLVLAQRIKVDRAAVLNALDGAAQDCLVPYLIHARRLEIPFQASRALVVIDPAGDEAAPPLETPEMAVVVVDESALDRPAAWSDLASQVALAWIRNVPGLAPQLTAELGLPEARSSSAQFAATGRLTIAALTALWLPRLAADSMATIQLGPAFTAGLTQSLKRSGGPEAALVGRIGRGFVVGSPPLHLRVYVSCVTLDRLGADDEASARWESWKKVVGEPETVGLASDRYPTLGIPLDRTYGYLAGVVEGVVTRPMGSLGGYPLGQIPSVMYDAETAKRTRAAASSLAGGEPVIEPPRTVLAAAALAAESAAQSESRIRRVALESLGDLVVAEAPRRRGGSAVGSPASLRAALGDPEFITRAVVVSAAFTRARGGRQRP